MREGVLVQIRCKAALASYRQETGATMSAMLTSPSILVVDDDPHLREVVRFALTREGFGVTEAKNGAEALQLWQSSAFALIVLDIMMPELDGVEVCRRIRQRSAVPIVFLSSRDEELDRVLGLELGGDDYITKPFSARELVARIKAVLRRGSDRDASTAPSSSPVAIRRHGKLQIDSDRFEVHWSGAPIVLTVTEFGLLAALASYPGKVFSREELMVKAYDEKTVVSDRTIDSHVRRLRSKLAAAGANPIDTVHGVGYRLGSCD